MKTGCNCGCIHRKEIKLAEMRETYDFRCEAMRCYMKHDDVKRSCKLYQEPYTVRPLTIDKFLTDYSAE